MNVVINVNKYSKEGGIELKWESNYKIIVNNCNNELTISANREGLLSLANHMINISQLDVPIGTHIHLDEYNSLEKGSVDLVIQKI